MEHQQESELSRVKLEYEGPREHEGLLRLVREVAASLRAGRVRIVPELPIFRVRRGPKDKGNKRA